MIDPRRVAVLIRSSRTGQFEDQTQEIARYETLPSGQVQVVYLSGRSYPFPPGRVQITSDLEPVAFDGDSRVEVDDEVWESATEVWKLHAPQGTWYRIFWLKQGQEKHSTRPASQVRVVTSAAAMPGVTEVLGYWRTVVSRLPADGSLARPFEKATGFVHSESALGRYLVGAPIEFRDLTAAPIFPFRCNLSQRQAVENALTRSVSVIEGPPGTGKTETILNLIANIVAVEQQSVGVVSFTNAAVDNVRDKLTELGFGHVLANLGRKEKRTEFLAAQAARNARVDQFVAEVPAAPSPQRLTALYERLLRLQEAERTRAQRRQEVDAHRLELRHFERHVESDELCDLDGLPLLRRRAGQILDYLAETEIELAGARPGLLRRIRNYFRYGSLRGLNPEDTAVVLRLQQAYYDKRIAELDGEIERLDSELRRENFDELAEEHRQLSLQLLRANLGTRYGSASRRTYAEDAFWKGRTFTEFIKDYPVLLSTCHALSDCVAGGRLLDYLIIDEASQVDLLTAALALASCRNLVVVGDQRQLPPIVKEAAGLVPPRPAYDVGRNLLSSLAELYGDDLPRTLLREHYRCDPAIIGFCNKSFYGGELIPYRIAGGERPMIVWRTPEGNHMRQYRGGGRSNQREVDVITREVIPHHCADVAMTDIGVTTPYRRQVDKVTDALMAQISELDGIEADTVHKYQGRQKPVMILTTVLDETWRGRTGLSFVDNPNLINVAVSRAIKRFILVTNNALMPTSRHISDLVGYIGYHNPGEEVSDSAVVSIFDLLYDAYSERLQKLAGRLRKEMKYRSEDIAWTVLREILAEERYAHLTVKAQILVRNLLPDLSRLTSEQARYVRNRASVDFVIYNRTTNEPRLAIEVDGYAFHENKPKQLVRDALKNAIFAAHQLRLLRLPTTGSEEQDKIRRELDAVEANWAQPS